MCTIHLKPMHYNVVIALKQGLRVDLIWCDSLQWNGQQALSTYSQYYHSLENDMNRPQRFQPNRHYSSGLTICTYSPTLPWQTNSTHCGLCTLLYHQTLSNWYGTAAGQVFTIDHIQELIRSLGTITQETAHEYRRRLRIHMHTWWTGIWNGADLIIPLGVH